eukprot:6130625-Pyramimonas_sp.AAC.1
MFGRLLASPPISRASSDWYPPRVYPLVPPPIGTRLGYILLSLLRLAPREASPPISRYPDTPDTPDTPP